MVRLTQILVASVAFTAASAVPLQHQKRIAQTIADSTTKWVAACTKAGGKDQCGTLSQAAFQTLLAAGKNCDQQDAADNMMDLSKKLNSQEMITLTQIFAQQPRNAPDSLQVPYCQTAPKNAELNGLFHCQFASSDFTKFSGDQTGNLPLGVSAVNPPGSCPAKNSPVPDGQQLTDLVTSPGTPAAAATATATADASASTATAAAGSGGAAPAGSKPFTLQNGKDAQALNKKFQSLTDSSPCTTGDQACLGADFAQCVGGKFVKTPCGSGTKCAALPLVNSAGTSITCSTDEQTTQRIAATGATGGVTGA
ncbi:hypothetical protein DENSPDRAFT_788439 [Dentipellis sp. KUC8613]|nr:hypothetical protein DENSPDRAFT_788439 [Dentipellis sp. KUC8613]